MSQINIDDTTNFKLSIVLFILVRETNKNQCRLHNGVPIVPPSGVNNELLQFRKTLTIWPMKDTIIQAINSHSVVIINGETGCGKTTQTFIHHHSYKAIVPYPMPRYRQPDEAQNRWSLSTPPKPFPTTNTSDMIREIIPKSTSRDCE
ncbi:3'-5' RNA helicase ythdc2 [Homalodisca vitripennis]|nr:3'-5' RNA helicase ythdc2 [Homalodisca vitripennis]